MTARAFPGLVVSVHDADTITASLDLGFRLTYRVSLRLAGINARELAQPGGWEAQQYLAELLPVGAPVTVTVLGLDKYGGRLEARVATAAGGDVAEQLVADGFAAAWSGRGPRPLPPWPREPAGSV